MKNTFVNNFNFVDFKNVDKDRCVFDKFDSEKERWFLPLGLEVVPM